MEVRRVPFKEQSRAEALGTARHYTALISKLEITMRVDKSFVDSIRSEFKGTGAMQYLSSLGEKYGQSLAKYEQSLARYVAGEDARLKSARADGTRMSLGLTAFGVAAYFLGMPVFLGIGVATLGVAGAYGYVQKRGSERDIEESERRIETGKEKLVRERDEVRDALSAAELALKG